MSDVLFMRGATPVTVAEILLAIGATALLLLLVLAVGIWRSGKTRALEADEQTMRADEIETRVAELIRAQTEMTGRIQSFAELLGGRQAELARTVTERLDSVSHRLGEGMTNAARATNESLGQLHERLAVVDAAQSRLAELSSHLVTLKDVLANKQSRGAFGQGRMEAIVADGLPKDAFAFQHTLSNGRRPDCVVFLPGDARPLVIDAKFPLESITAFREAKNDAELRVSAQRLRQDITKHVSDIAERYFLPGETQDIALMFVPSESLYAEIHENFDDLMQKAFRARVMLVSPSLLMLSIQVLQVIVKDARMQEQTEIIRSEVGKLMEDIGRLRDRAFNLQKHFGQASEDIEQVLISADKLTKRGARIEALEFEAGPAASGKRPEIPAPLGLKLGAAEVIKRPMAESIPAASDRGLLNAWSVYLRPRVLVVMFLGFSSGLPLALSGSTLLVWMRESGVDLGTIGLFAAVGTPYTIKFLWAPLVDALDVPLLSRLFGRRRGWLIFSQILLIAAIVFLGLCDPVTSLRFVALGALLVATASATQDIVIDAFRVESLDEREQAAGMASYVAAYRIGMLASTAGALFLVSGFEAYGFDKHAAWSAGYIVTAAFVVIGILATLFAIEPEKSAAANAVHASENPLTRVFSAAYGAFSEFLSRDLAFVILAFVVLFKFTDALAGAMTAPFVIDLGFSRNEYAAIIKGVGLAATLIGGFAGGMVARAYPLAASLWIGGILQAVANLAFSWQATRGHDIGWLTFAIVAENFTGAIGTVIFVAYLSALCKNPLHTATQFALLTALAAVGRTYLSSGAGFVAAATGWAAFFAICALAAIPGLVLLAWLQARGHFSALERKS